MNVQKTKTMLQIKEWSEQINDRSQSGLTVREWCENQGIAVKTYYYRQKRVREELLESRFLAEQANQKKSIFAEVSMSRMESASVTVRIGTSIVGINNGADMTMVERILQTVSRI